MRICKKMVGWYDSVYLVFFPHLVNSFLPPLIIIPPQLFLKILVDCWARHVDHCRPCRKPFVFIHPPSRYIPSFIYRFTDCMQLLVEFLWMNWRFLCNLFRKCNCIETCRIACFNLNEFWSKDVYIISLLL